MHSGLLIFLGLVAGLPLERKVRTSFWVLELRLTSTQSTSSPGTMKGYLQLRDEVTAVMRPYPASGVNNNSVAR
ncbi:hypothetical protein B0H19DRAFT_1270287 [Mycena capillaripes]|nr:hypothetical protein B0H19DRAFT_1270287 [Mycena capillaripes]